MIKIECNDKGIREKKYVFDIVFNEFFGLDYSLIIDADIEDIRINFGENRRVVLNSTFFNAIDIHWGKAESLPATPLKVFRIENIPFKLRVDFTTIPVVYGVPNLFAENVGINCGIDIFGTVFFMLVRYEEMIDSTIDRRGRFPAEASLAYKEDFLLRPIVNEYLEILWAMMSNLDNTLIRRERKFKVTLTCDVDWPYNPTNRSISTLVKELGKDLIRKKSIKQFIAHIKEYIWVKFAGWKYDSHNTFNYLMTLAEANNISMFFYFICDNTAGRIDGNYSMDDSNILRLIKEINSRGHQIGMHGSYNTFLDMAQLKKEYNILMDVIKKLDINQQLIGSRQHYLRYRTSETIRHLNSVGLDFDSSLSYADHVGFRSGTCYEYTMYDVQQRCKLNIKERPLIAMEASVLSSSYMNKGYTEEALNIFVSLRKECQKYNGDFVLLWHNSYFFSHKDREILEGILNVDF